jgi:endoglucanase
VQRTTTFWSNVAPQFANDSHVLFELYNEPINSGDWPTLRDHMQSWYDTVRRSAPDNLVLVGTPSWDQEIGETAANPVNGSNIAYVSHTYPMHWAWDEHRQGIQQAAAAHPVVVTEWGYQAPSGGMNDATGGTLSDYAEPWREFVDGLGLSWTAWVASSTWGPPMFAFGGAGLTEFGQFAKTWLSDTRDQDRPADL